MSEAPPADAGNTKTQTKGFSPDVVSYLEWKKAPTSPMPDGAGILEQAIATAEVTPSSPIVVAEVTPPDEEIPATELSLRGMSGIIEARRQKRSTKQRANKQSAEARALAAEGNPGAYIPSPEVEKLTDAEMKLRAVEAAHKRINMRAEDAISAGGNTKVPLATIKLGPSVLKPHQKALEKLHPATPHRKKAAKHEKKAEKLKEKNAKLVARKREAAGVKARRKQDRYIKRTLYTEIAKEQSTRAKKTAIRGAKATGRGVMSAAKAGGRAGKFWVDSAAHAAGDGTKAIIRGTSRGAEHVGLRPEQQSTAARYYLERGKYALGQRKVDKDKEEDEKTPKTRKKMTPEAKRAMTRDIMRSAIPLPRRK